MENTITKTDFITTELQKFNVSDSAIAEMRDNFLSIRVADHTDKFHAEVARNRRIEVKNLRVAVEKKRKELKEDSLRVGSAIDAEAKRITAMLEPIEKHLQEQEDIVAKHQARIEAEAAAKLKAEAEARETERLALLAEKAEYERKIAELEREKVHRAEVEQAALRAAEQAAFATEQRMKREAEEKERAVKAEAERAARAAAAAPDREKLLAFAEKLEALDMPFLSTEIGVTVRNQILGQLNQIVRFTRARAEELS